MNPRQRMPQIVAAIFAAGLLAALIAPFATRFMRAASASYYVSPSGSDTNSGTSASAPFKSIQKAVDLAQPGAVINLAAGVYVQDLRSARDGAPDAPITIQGPADAVVEGGGSARIIEINHDHITLAGFTIDGLWGDPNSIAGYRDKLLYVLGKQPRDGVSGLRVLGMTFRNAGGECVRLRYFAQHNEIAGSSIANCGVHDFRFQAGGKNGEGIYIGTAPEQLGDGKNPTADADQSNDNWIHHNTFNTQGNECVDIKEAAAGNIVEQNTCTGQRDPESGGFDARGSGNIFRANESYSNMGAGIRLGGDTATDGIGNDVYANIIHDNQSGGIKVQQQPQGKVCGNTMDNNGGGNVVGSYSGSLDPTAPCGDTAPSPSPTSTATPAPASIPQPAPAGAGCTRSYTIDGHANSFIEAEQHSTSNGRFAEMLDPSRSNGSYMNIPGSGMHKDRATYLTFDIALANGGKFYVWLLGYGPDGSADSFYVQADSGKTTGVSLSRAGWGWKRAGSALTLGDGSHTLKIRDREDGSSVDKILLTRDEHYRPVGLGDTALAAQCQ